SSILKSTAVVLALALHANAHAMATPALGISGTPKRSDTQRPSTKSPCGSVDIASNLDKSAAVPVEDDGTTVNLNVTNFNAGGDGSRSVSVLVDVTGTGKKFVAAKVTKNGDANPKTDGTDVVTISLPAGTQCAGGTDGNRCLLSVKSTAGFGNCVVVTQTASSAPAVSSSSADASPSTSAAAATIPSASTAAAPSASASTGGSSTKSKAKVPCTSNRKRRALGTRLPRALRLAASVSGSGSGSEGLHPHPFFASTPL
ncbi:hypothetical protein DFH06DRAFT_1209832, partial [Mycena polygramma]